MLLHLEVLQLPVRKEGLLSSNRHHGLKFKGPGFRAITGSNVRDVLAHALGQPTTCLPSLNLFLITLEDLLLELTILLHDDRGLGSQPTQL